MSRRDAEGDSGCVMVFREAVALRRLNNKTDRIGYSIDNGVCTATVFPDATRNTASP